MLANTALFSLAALASFQAAQAAPVPRFVHTPSPVRHMRREVPQEHSHEQFLTTVRASLNKNNPLAIADPVFGLLGNAAAAGATNKVAANCVQSATADQAFTNAKANNDIAGMTAALVFRALERNSGAVGATSEACTSFTPVNPEIKAISQHQDPASTNAAAVNKAIVLELARQIASIGGDPQIALKSGTFAPGTIGDPTGRGNSCDTLDDPVGCIFTQNLIVNDATAAEIDAAVAGAGGAVVVSTTAVAAASTTSAAAQATATVTEEEDCFDEIPTATAAPTIVTVTVSATDCAATQTAAATLIAAAPAATATAAPATSGTNLQKFTGALGGVTAPAVTAGGRGFLVAGQNDNGALNVNASLQRSCDVQKNKCANVANGSRTAGFSVGDCDAQQQQCTALF